MSEGKRDMEEAADKTIEERIDDNISLLDEL